MQGKRGNGCMAAFVGDMVQRGITNGNPHIHYSLLRLIDDNFAVGTLNREDSKASPICCIWNNR